MGHTFYKYCELATGHLPPGKSEDDEDCLGRTEAASFIWKFIKYHLDEARELIKAHKAATLSGAGSAPDPKIGTDDDNQLENSIVRFPNGVYSVLTKYWLGKGGHGQVRLHIPIKTIEAFLEDDSLPRDDDEIPTIDAIAKKLDEKTFRAVKSWYFSERLDDFKLGIAVYQALYESFGVARCQRKSKRANRSLEVGYLDMPLEADALEHFLRSDERLKFIKDDRLHNCRVRRQRLAMALTLINTLKHYHELEVEVDGYDDKQHVVHCDLKPANVVFNPVTFEMRVVDLDFVTVAGEAIGEVRGSVLYADHNILYKNAVADRKNDYHGLAGMLADILGISSEVFADKLREHAEFLAKGKKEGLDKKVAKKNADIRAIRTPYKFDLEHGIPGFPMQDSEPLLLMLKKLSASKLKRRSASLDEPIKAVNQLIRKNLILEFQHVFISKELSIALTGVVLEFFPELVYQSDIYTLVGEALLKLQATDTDDNAKYLKLLHAELIVNEGFTRELSKRQKYKESIDALLETPIEHSLKAEDHHIPAFEYTTDEEARARHASLEAPITFDLVNKKAVARQEFIYALEAEASRLAGSHSIKTSVVQPLRDPVARPKSSAPVSWLWRAASGAATGFAAYSQNWMFGPQMKQKAEDLQRIIAKLKQPNGELSEADKVVICRHCGAGQLVGGKTTTEQALDRYLAELLDIDSTASNILNETVSIHDSSVVVVGGGGSSPKGGFRCGLY